MAAIDLLFDLKLASERLHQLVLGSILTRSTLLAELEIPGEPIRDEWEPNGGLFDLVVELRDTDTSIPGTRRVWIELKIDSGLGPNQLNRQFEFLAGEEAQRDHVLYLLLGTAALHSAGAEFDGRLTGRSESLGVVSTAIRGPKLVECLAAAAPRQGGSDDAAWQRERRDIRDLLVAYGDAVARVQERVKGFEKQPLDDWSGVDYLGFYDRCRSEIPGMEHAGFGYVATPDGGFMACWWGWALPGESADELYVQIEGDRHSAANMKLCFKIAVDDEAQQSVLRNRISGKLLRVAEEVGVPVRKPPRFGKGRVMTVAVLDTPLLRKDAEWEDNWTTAMVAVEQANRLLAEFRSSHLESWLRVQSEVPE